MYATHNLYFAVFLEKLWDILLVVGGVGFLLCLIVGFITKDE